MTNNFLALGDSYTIGEGVPEAQRWPMQLTASLQEAGISIECPKIIAQTGWTTDELSAAINAAELHPPYELVSLLIGVNNQYRGYILKNYEEEFSVLLNHAIRFAGNRPDHVIVLSIPDWGVTPFGQRSGRDLATIAQEIDSFNAANFSESKRQKVHYVNITPLTRQLGAQPEMLVEDGLHPSGTLYRLWVSATLPIVKPIFSYT